MHLTRLSAPGILLLLLLASAGAQQDSLATEVPQSVVVADEPAPAAESGVLQIVAYPERSTVYLDGVKMGQGTLVVDDVSAGQHTVDVVHGEHREEQEVHVRPGRVTRLEVAAGRETRIVTGVAYSHLWVRGRQCFGPLAELSVAHRRSYYGVSFGYVSMAKHVVEEFSSYEPDSYDYYDWLAYGREYGNALVWTAHWLYEIASVRGILRVATGPALSVIHGPVTEESPNLVNAGGLVKIMVGHGRVYAAVTTGILAGSSFNKFLYYGLQYHF